MIFAGIDAGSRAIKIILINDNCKVIASGIIDQGVEQNTLLSNLFETLLKENHLSRSKISKIVATGYGRNMVNFADTTITEITCQTYGVRHLVPDVKTIIDIGGQDSKVIKLNRDGTVRDFAMNDRCAAGTGRFLEVVAERLGVKLKHLGKLVEKSKSPVTINSTCVVFAESEIIGLLASGTSSNDIVAGVQSAIAIRIGTMVGQNTDLPIVFTGGVAKVSGMKGALEKALNQPVIIAPEPQYTNALGAAILASRQ